MLAASFLLFWGHGLAGVVWHGGCAFELQLLAVASQLWESEPALGISFKKSATFKPIAASR